MSYAYGLGLSLNRETRVFPSGLWACTQTLLPIFLHLSKGGKESSQTDLRPEVYSTKGHHTHTVIPPAIQQGEPQYASLICPAAK